VCRYWSVAVSMIHRQNTLLLAFLHAEWILIEAEWLDNMLTGICAELMPLLGGFGCYGS